LSHDKRYIEDFELWLAAQPPMKVVVDYRGADAGDRFKDTA
jgi:hypothetical protein